MKLNGIDISFLHPKSRNNGTSNLCFWSPYHNDTYFLRNPTITLHSKADLDDAFKTKYSDLTGITKLYFDSSSTYPRFKIKDTTFQRVIKVSKCEAAVVSDQIRYVAGGGSFQVYEYTKPDSSKIVYCVSPEEFKKEDLFIYNEVCSYGSDFIDGAKTLNYIPKGSILIYSGELCFCDSVYAEALDNIINVYPKYTKESTLDKIVNGTLEDINEETLLSLNDMLSSSDNSVVELGLKILQGLNVTKFPTSITCLIYGNYAYMLGNKALNTTGVNQVLKSLNIIASYVPRDPISGLINVCKNAVWKNADAEDLKLATILCKSIITKYLQDRDKKILESLPNLSISIKTYVD